MDIGMTEAGTGSKTGRSVVLRMAVTLAVLTLLLVAALGAMVLSVQLSGGSHVVSTSEVTPAPVAIVLGASVYLDGRPSPVLRDRLDTGLQLYRDGKVDKILLSGDGGTGGRSPRPDQLAVMRSYLLDHGVTPDDLLEDGLGYDTFDSMYRAREIFGVESAIVSTQRFHLARALFIADGLGMEVQGVAADQREYQGELRFRVRDLLASVKAFLQVRVLTQRPGTA